MGSGYSLSLDNENNVVHEELAHYINNSMQQYENIILHGHSKCGSCFIEATKFLKRKVTIISVSAPINKEGTPFADRHLFDTRLNWLEKLFLHKIFSDYNIDKDLCKNSKFLTNLSLDYLTHHKHLIVVSECGKFTFNPTQLLLTWIDKSKMINGDGIISKSSPDLKGLGCFSLYSVKYSSLLLHSIKILLFGNISCFNIFSASIVSNFFLTNLFNGLAP